MGNSQNNLFEKERDELIDSCIKGDIENAIKIHLKLSAFVSDEFIFKNVEHTFKYVCQHGYLNVAKWLFEKNPKMNISAYGESAFRLACMNGRLQIIEWLLEIKPSIDISIDDDWAFKNACLGGHLHIAKYLFKNRPNILFSNISNKSFDLLITKLKDNLRYDVVKWLEEVIIHKELFDKLYL